MKFTVPADTNQDSIGLKFLVAVLMSPVRTKESERQAKTRKARRKGGTLLIQWNPQAQTILFQVPRTLFLLAPDRRKKSTKKWFLT